ncbi:MAG: hypothetical protein NWF10_00755 [Candidatus Bathyarchaeota archaeon]|nr:hypothetical protein [Candidatus Bathyarchaeota archaeon]
MLLEFFVKNVLQRHLGRRLALTLKELRMTDCLIYIGIRYGLLFLEKELKEHIETEEVTDSDVILEGVAQQ